MATSSMHKPGWRSRRRSRLSLVERAIPRLGRALEPKSDIPAKGDIEARLTADAPVPPENPPQGEEALPAPPAPDAKAGTEMPAVDVPAASGEVRLVHARDAADEEGQPVSEEGASAHPPPDETDDLPDEERTGGLIDDETVVDQDRADALASEAGEQAASPLDDQAAGGPEAETPVPLTDAKAQTPEMLLDDATSDDRMSDEVAGWGATHRYGDQPSSNDQSLKLDWAGLIENGFVDPRDRGRPLAPNMDDIVRVLLRQALSDQASWRDRVILVTSPTERTSKSTAAINFSLGLTTVGDHRTVLVDVDTTGPGAVERLGGADRTGISEALGDDAIAIEDLIVETDLDRLTLVPSGPSDDELLDRFASHRMLSILRFLTENPDTLLIIDAPPILASQEAAVLSVVAGQVVMAVEAGVTTADQIEHALQRIGERHNVSLILVETGGIVREDMPPAPASGRAPARKSRRASLVKRRPSQFAAAAVGAVACGLFLSKPADDTTSSRVYAQPVWNVSTIAAVPPERLSIDDLASGSSFRRMGR